MVIAMKNRMEQINMLLEQDGMEVSLQERFKNNQLKQGMVLRSKEFNCSPVIYVDEKFWELSDLEIAEQLQNMSSASNQQLIWIASISLLVGGIGVMNIMLVSVTERTSEIGLKKALGAKKRRIRGQFLMEAAVLTCLGGILGVCAGIGMAELISRANEIPVAISVPAILIAVLFSTVIGVIFGLLPAVKAANLSPIEALRRE